MQIEVGMCKQYFEDLQINEIIYGYVGRGPHPSIYPERTGDVKGRRSSSMYLSREDRRREGQEGQKWRVQVPGR
jgi:hypothetical protein